jgi:type III secretory pathway component EscU
MLRLLKIILSDHALQFLIFAIICYPLERVAFLEELKMIYDV